MTYPSDEDIVARFRDETGLECEVADMYYSKYGVHDKFTVTLLVGSMNITVHQYPPNREVNVYTLARDAAQVYTGNIERFERWRGDNGTVSQDPVDILQGPGE